MHALSLLSLLTLSLSAAAYRVVDPMNTTVWEHVLNFSKTRRQRGHPPSGFSLVNVFAETVTVLEW